MTNRAAGVAEEFDIVVIGAGISGIGAASYFSRELSDRSLVVLEGREHIGGTWDLFRYPGIRSDSDLHTFGYEFKPWRHENAIADAPLILEYLRETVEENSLAPLIRTGHRVRCAEWSSAESRWSLTVETTDFATGAVSTKTIKAGWIFAASGYYKYDEGYSPAFEGSEDFEGTLVHPQHWPEGLDYSGKRVVVIGSGATAVTLVPAMLKGSGAAGHVTMLQRTPSYVMPLPRVDRTALALTKLLGAKRGYAATRFKNIWSEHFLVEGLRRFPRAGRALIRSENIKKLGKDFDVDTHFNPPYNPWDQRLCAAPDGDFFDALRSDRASVVTDSIARFSGRGVILGSGEELEADIIVTATGLNLQLFDGMPIVVDGREIDLFESVAYRGTLLSGIPNWAMAIGYTTSSWTLKVSLLCRYFIDLVRYMDARGYDTVVPVAPPGMATKAVMDLQSGYAKRGERRLPRQGSIGPWRTMMSYPQDAKALRGPVVDENLKFGVAETPSADDIGGASAAESRDRFATLASGIRVCFRDTGDRSDPALMLIGGLGEDLTFWGDSLVNSLVQRGFRVISFDNRDVGRSSFIDTPPPSLWRQALARPRRDGYTLADMADDAIGLLDHLGIARVHLVGRSMGGMIAQSIASAVPARVLSLTSIYSTTGSTKVGQPAKSTMRLLMSPSARNREEAIRAHLRITRHIAGRGYPIDPLAEADIAGGGWDRAAGSLADGGARQIQAIQRSGDRTPQLRRITAPTLVINGDRDLMVAETGGAATAEAIQGARHIVIPGMGHHLPESLVDTITEHIAAHAAVHEGEKHVELA